MCAETCLVSLNNEPFCDRRQSHWDKHYVKYVLAYVPGGKSSQLRRYQQRSELLSTTPKVSIDKMQVLWTAFFRCPKGIKKQGQCPVIKKYTCIFRSVSAHNPFVLCMVSAETVHGERLNCAWIPRGWVLTIYMCHGIIRMLLAVQEDKATQGVRPERLIRGLARRVMPGASLFFYV